MNVTLNDIENEQMYFEHFGKHSSQEIAQEMFKLTREYLMSQNEMKEEEPPAKKRRTKE